MIKTYGIELPGVKVVTNTLYHDNRGYFLETYKTNTDQMRGMFRQVNTAYSVYNVLRGMHRQDQTKLIMPVQGTIFDVALDPVTGAWFGVELDEKCGLLIPPQYAHGYLVTSETAIVQYVVDAPWDKTKEEHFKWDEYNIDWPLFNEGDPILSDKDR